MSSKRVWLPRRLVVWEGWSRPKEIIVRKWANGYANTPVVTRERPPQGLPMDIVKVRITLEVLDEHTQAE